MFFNEYFIDFFYVVFFSLGNIIYKKKKILKFLYKYINYVWLIYGDIKIYKIFYYNIKMYMCLLVGMSNKWKILNIYFYLIFDSCFIFVNNLNILFN